MPPRATNARPARRTLAFTVFPPGRPRPPPRPRLPRPPPRRPGLVAIGAVPLAEVGFGGLELGVIGLGVGGEEGEKLTVLGDGQDVAAGAPFLHVGGGQGGTRPGLICA